MRCCQFFRSVRGFSVCAVNVSLLLMLIINSLVFCSIFAVVWVFILFSVKHSCLVLYGLVRL
jgi:hypothetical protein